MATGLFMKHRWVRAGGVFLAALVLVYWLWPNPSAAPATPLPSPNGYDDFVKAGSLITPISADAARMTTEELRAFIATNQEPLRLFRLGLMRECQVPTEDSTAYIRRHLSDLSWIKRLAFFVVGQARLAEVEMNYGAAALFHLDYIRLGQVSANGGLIIDKLTGVAVETLGVSKLEAIAGKLDAREARESVTALEAIEVRAQPASVFIERDRQWSRKALSLFPWFEEWVMRKTIAASDQKFTAKVQASDARRRRLLLNLAKRVHELETGRPPARLEDMVPSILRALPKLDGAVTNSNSQTPASP
jgi:hypothetical protein